MTLTILIVQALDSKNYLIYIYKFLFFFLFIRVLVITKKNQRKILK